jgi:hypothetical protein
MKYHKTPNDTIIAELTDDKFILHTDFFQLKTGLAGDILQKFSNYKVKLAIIGDFSKYESRSLSDFIRECNKGNMIFFLDSMNSAMMRLTKKY